VFRAEGGIGPAGTSSLVVDPGARYQIINVNSGKCLAVMGGDGTQVTQQTCTTGTNMTFSLERTPSRLTVIHPVQAPASCLDIYDGSTSNEAAVEQWTCHKGGNQQFQFTVVSGNITPIVNITNEKSKLALDVKFSGLDNGVIVWQYTPNTSTAQQFTLRRVA
jgi:hypothetical protein